MSTSPMGWQDPKTDWQAADLVGPSDFNRIESNIDAIEQGSRTLDPAQAPSGNVGSLRQLLDWFANRIKAITGKANWYDTPATTLEAAKAHMDAAAPHSGHVKKAGDMMTGDLTINTDSNPSIFYNENGQSRGRSVYSTVANAMLIQTVDSGGAWTTRLQVPGEQDSGVAKFANVDDIQINGNTVRHDGNMTIVTGVAADGTAVSSLVPAGYTREQCEIIVSINRLSGYLGDYSLNEIYCEIDTDNDTIRCWGKDSGGHTRSGYANYMIIARK